MNRTVIAAMAATAVMVASVAGHPQGATAAAGQAHPITTARRLAVPATPNRIDHTHPAPTPKIVIHAERPAEVEVAARGLAKFEQAGLTLPDLEIHFPADRTGCDDAFGRYQHYDTSPDLVELCSPSEATLLHELGHAWAKHHLTRAQQASFLQMRDLQQWTGNHLAWHDRGSEHAASIIAWGLWNNARARTMTITTDDTETTLANAFVLLTGRQPLHTHSRALPRADTVGTLPRTEPPEATSRPPTTDQANPASSVTAHHDPSEFQVAVPDTSSCSIPLIQSTRADRHIGERCANRLRPPPRGVRAPPVTPAQRRRATV